MAIAATPTASEAGPSGRPRAISSSVHQPGAGQRQAHKKSGIIKLCIPVLHSTSEPISFYPRKKCDGVLAAQCAGGGDTEFSGEGIIYPHSRAIPRLVPPFIARNNETQWFYKIGSIIEEATALAKRFVHHFDVPLPEIAHAAVNQLGTSAGSPLTEVVRFEKQRSITSGCRIHGSTDWARAQRSTHHGRLRQRFRARRACHTTRERCQGSHNTGGTPT